ncbi:MAG: hypothetical protein MI742_11105 [Desulfobacterales bacterium]|nr:hypothetical protein [Desulfobacterales bacterium]
MTTVFIWNNNQITHKISSKIGYTPSSKAVIGHACMNIHDHFTSLFNETFDGLSNNDDSHVSWWPAGEGANKRDSVGTGKSSGNLLHDVFLETYAPDHIIRIDNPPLSHIQRMEKEWEKQLKKEHEPGSYHFMKENCSRIVSRVLRRGYNMGRGNIKYGQVASGIWTPLMVKRLAMDLKGGPKLDKPARQLTWSQFINELVEEGVIFPKTGSLLKLLKRRASNRGSSGANARFDFSKEDSILERFQKKSLPKFTKEKNFPMSLIGYTEARGLQYSIEDSEEVTMELLGLELQPNEFAEFTRSGKSARWMNFAETVPTLISAKPKRRKTVSKENASMRKSTKGAPPPQPSR